MASKNLIYEVGGEEGIMWEVNTGSSLLDGLLLYRSD
jgi:hypothetical protein